jgi:ABC-2 type transport system permease protein
MFTTTIFRYEWRQLWRDRWIIAVLGLFLLLTAYAVFNGTEKVATRTGAIAKAKEELARAEAKQKSDIDSVAAGLKVVKETWRDPRLLSMVGSRLPRVAAMEAEPFAFVATGQSDLFTHYTRPVLYGEASALGFSELSNPVQLLFGSFDLAFVCIYLLPLLVLAFSYNILSAERESGTLRLTLAQPISVLRWLLAKLAVRFLILTAIVVFSVVLSFLAFGFPVHEHVGQMLLLFGFVLPYMLFWFLVALLVNLLGQSSGSNAVALVSIWIALVLIVPAVISQMANTLYPVPSRIHLLHQYRLAEAAAEKNANQILKDYYRAHPELAPKDSTQTNQYQFWLEYFASLDVVKAAVQPVLDRHDRALRAQQQWVEQLRFASPSILLQTSLNQLAGTAPANYTAFREQVIRFADDWRGYFMPRMFANERMQPADFDQLPAFTYEPPQVRTFATDALVLIFFCAVVLGLSVWQYQKRTAAASLAS